MAKTTKSRLSEPTSKKQEKTAEGTSKLFTPEEPEKPSVRKELREIQNARKKEAERRENRNDPVRNQGNNGTIDHVGIVESVSDGTVNTIEGNSGDKVARRNYSIGSSNIYGYGVPAY